MTAEGYSSIPNWLFRDSDISLYALVVYGALASHSGPGGIHPAQSTIAKEARCSERQVRSALAELETMGLVERVRRKNALGRASNGYVLHPHGHLSEDEEFVSEVTAHHAGTSEVAAPGAGGYGTETQLVPLIEEKPNKKNVEEAFEEFWKVYPRHAARAAALRAFLGQAKHVDPRLIIDGARRLAADPNLPKIPQEERFIPHASSWLNAQRWDDGPLPERGSDRLAEVRQLRPEAFAGLERDEWMLR